MHTRTLTDHTVSSLGHPNQPLKTIQYNVVLILIELPMSDDHLLGVGHQTLTIFGHANSFGPGFSPPAKVWIHNIIRAPYQDKTRFIRAHGLGGHREPRHPSRHAPHVWEYFPFHRLVVASLVRHGCSLVYHILGGGPLGIGGSVTM